MKTRLLALALTAALPAAAAENTTVSQLRGMSLADLLEVDISTGTTKFLREAPATAYVITAEDIARLGARNVLEVLEAVPGLNVHLYQGPGTNSPMVDVRGGFTSIAGQVLFLRDGRPLRLIPNITMPEIFRLPVQYVERIEIARGPGSAVYGADALTGTVNIITRRKPVEAGVRLGAPEHRGAWAGYNGVAGGVEWAVAGQHSRHVDDAVTRLIPPQGAARLFTQEFQHEYNDFDLKLRTGPWSANVWMLNYDKVETGNPTNPRGMVSVQTQHRHLDVGYATDLGPTTQFAAFGLYTRFRSLRSGELLQGVPTDDKNAEVRSRLEASFTETRFADHRLRAIVGAYRERRVEITPQSPPRPPNAPPPVRNNRYDHYFAIQDEWRFTRDWELTLGVRSDHYGDYGTITNPRAGLVWTASPRLTTKLLLAQAARAPQYGDPGLAGQNSERLRNAEFVVDYRPASNWSLVTSLYKYRTSNIVEGQGPNAMLASRDGRGTEISLGWQPAPAWRLDAGFAYADARNQITDARLALTPRETIKASLNWRPTAQLAFDLRWEAYFDRVRAPTDPRPPLEDFNVGHFTARYAYTARTSLLFIAHNLLNERAWIPFVAGGNQDAQLLERSLSVQVEHRF